MPVGVRSEGSAARLPSNDAQFVEPLVDRPFLLVTQLRVPHASMPVLPLVELASEMPLLSMTQLRVPHAYMPRVQIVEPSIDPPALSVAKLRVPLVESPGDLPSVSAIWLSTRPWRRHVWSRGDVLSVLAQWPSFANETV